MAANTTQRCQPVSRNATGATYPCPAAQQPEILSRRRLTNGARHHPDCLFSGASTAVHRELLERGGSRLTRIWADRYTRPQTGHRQHPAPAGDCRLPLYAQQPTHRGAGADGGTIDACGAQPPRICASNGRPRRPQTPPVHTSRRCRHLYTDGRHICARRFSTTDAR